MKIKAFSVAALAFLAIPFARADEGDILLTFSTPGIDRYADGTQVLDGEWYAVCWSSDGVFEGLTTDCKPIDPNDELILAVSRAKGGRCPLTAFEFARKNAYGSGKFSVFMLDTRDANGRVAARGANGLPVFVQGEAVAMTAQKDGQSLEVVAASQASSVGGTDGAWGQIALQSENVAPATITAFEIVGENVQLTVSGLGEGTVVVKTGETVGAMNTFAVPKVSADDQAKFVIPKSKGRFFSVHTVK